jgi:hypothetical protein
VDPCVAASLQASQSDHRWPDADQPYSVQAGNVVAVAHRLAKADDQAAALPKTKALDLPLDHPARMLVRPGDLLAPVMGEFHTGPHTVLIYSMRARNRFVQVLPDGNGVSLRVARLSAASNLALGEVQAALAAHKAPPSRPSPLK